MAEENTESNAARVLRQIKDNPNTKPVYEPLDLSTISDEYTGSIDVLRNPTKLFRRTFWGSSLSGREMAEWTGFIFNMAPDQAREWLDNIDQALYIYLIAGMPIEDDSGNTVYKLGHIYRLWDEYAQGRAKKLFMR